MQRYGVLAASVVALQALCATGFVPCTQRAALHSDSSSSSQMHMMITSDRQGFVATAAAAAALALTAAPQAVSAALDPQRDASLARAPPPARLLPILRVKLQVEGIQALLGDPAGWEAAREKLMDKALSKSEYRRVFDEYSTDNW
eukprot:TRINITY_DN1203_c3_g6_i1.p2 TRINITY_DN1203_c3_g6~~TRINITY_DN1203_c3_g6_i1.p2  ORF type:complete len:156 (-),score=52.50 TRINITY_DN1203_c3_g6_i1:662-1096(-)